MSNELLSILISLFKLYNPVIIIDDVHKCQADNFVLKNMFESIIENELCIIYFIGWFNIFKKSFVINRSMKVVVLEGLSDHFLDQIIIKHIGQSKKEIATLIQDKYNGLPGYAILVKEDTCQDTLETNDTFLHGFIKCLDYSERIALFILTFSSIPISINHWEKLNMVDSVYSLVDKRLVERKGNYFSIHDKYRPFFKNYPLNDIEFKNVIKALNAISSSEVEILIDLIDVYLEHSKTEEAYIILQKSFTLFLHNQLIKNTLKRLQIIESTQIGTRYLIDILKMKIVLLERLSQYDTCIGYISLIQSENSLCNKQWENIYYIYLRCLYFTNQYDLLLNSVFDHIDYIMNEATTEIKIQIFLVAGRVYYVRGDLETSLILYLLSYQEAVPIKNLSLVMKSIHRISMIECSSGFITESKKTFDTLSNLDNIITPKRKSYAYYRIAKCCYLLDELNDGIEYTKKSISIKESFGDIRGLAFSYKTYAKIYFKQRNYVDAIVYINEARNVALKLGLNKEVLSINIILVENVLRYNIDYDEKELYKMLYEGLKTAVEEKLLYRIKTISKLAENRWDDIFYASNKEYDKIFTLLEQDKKNYIDLFYDSLNENSKDCYKILSSKSKSISYRLLINVGILPKEYRDIT